MHPISPVTKDLMAVESPTILLTALGAYFLIVAGRAAAVTPVPLDFNCQWVRVHCEMEVL